MRAFTLLRHSWAFAHASCRIRAIDDARREDENLKITYEALVDELDVGDSFTTQLIEVLVKVCRGSY